jgi:iron complex transport system substrate-binding protein
MATTRAGFRLLVSMAVVALAACSGCGGAGTADTKQAAARAISPAFPLTLQTSSGSVTIPHRPSRIISLSPSATEDLYAVGAGKQVVAVDSYSTYPKNAPQTKLSGDTPNVEAIAGYQPDLVVVADDTNQIVAQLGKLQIPALVEPPPKNLDGAYGQIDQIARATGHERAAKRVVTTMRRQVRAIVASVPRPRVALTVYHELDQTYYSVTSQTVIGQIYRLLGLKNVADKAKASSVYPQLSAEYIIASNPDLIVLADTVCCGQTEATVAARPGWSDIRAVKSGEVVSVNDSIASQWGPRIVLFLKAVARAVKRLEGHVS